VGVAARQMNSTAGLRNVKHTPHPPLKHYLHVVELILSKANGMSYQSGVTRGLHERVDPTDYFGLDRSWSGIVDRIHVDVG
jgi:hypothetical protein